jgi:hypothetical protein
MWFSSQNGVPEAKTIKNSTFIPSVMVNAQKTTVNRHGGQGQPGRGFALSRRTTAWLQEIGRDGRVAKSLGRSNAAQSICREVLSRAAVSNPVR